MAWIGRPAPGRAHAQATGRPDGDTAMTILISIQPARSRRGVTTQRVCLQSGTLIGLVEHATEEAFTARSAEGHPLVHGDTAMTFPSLTDAAAAVWLGFMARSPTPGT
jgi:hypothetical protein